jgi:hypothetical protein
MAQKTHAIIGTGATSKKALFQSLEEVVKEGDAVSLVWAGPPNETVELAYDYVIDNEIEFTMFYEDGKQPPKVFRVSDVGVTQKSRNPLIAAAKSVSDGGKVLVLWDDDEQDDYVNAGDAVAAGTLFLDLSNGLAPIIFEDEDEEVEEVEVEEEPEEEVETFTRDELLNMPAAAVKRYGSAKGVKAATKGGIIDELFPEMEEEEEEVEEAKPTPKVGDKVPKPALPEFPKNSNEEDQWVKLERSLTNITPSAEAIVRIEAMRESFKGTGALILAFAPFGRERALAITKLEEAAMWAVKAIVLGSEVE